VNSGLAPNLNDSMPLRRLDQILSRSGYCSRSEAKIWVRSGRVRIGTERASAAEQKAEPAEVRVDGEPVECPEGLLAIFHKPPGCVCSHETREGPNIYQLLPERWSRRNPPVTSVGRLDKDTTGLLLVTDDGALVQRWTSPRHKVTKLYEVVVDRELDPALTALFATGELLLAGEEKPCLPARLDIVSPTEARLELVEGRFHQVKRMFASQGYEVAKLHRSRFGEFTLEDLAPGHWRFLPIEQYRR
jgi:16S rRNA pseudouridine516 synthase